MDNRAGLVEGSIIDEYTTPSKDVVKGHLMRQYGEVSAMPTLNADSGHLNA